MNLELVNVFSLPILILFCIFLTLFIIITKFNKVKKGNENKTRAEIIGECGESKVNYMIKGFSNKGELLNY